MLKVLKWFLSSTVAEEASFVLSQYMKVLDSCEQSFNIVDEFVCYKYSINNTSIFKFKTVDLLRSFVLSKRLSLIHAGKINKYPKPGELSCDVLCYLKIKNSALKEVIGAS